MKRAIVAAMLTALGIGSAYALEDNERGLYVGVGWGAYNVQIDDVDETDEAISEIDEEENVWRAFVGYRFNNWFAAELNYADWGDTDYDAAGTTGDYRVTLEGSGIQPAVYGILPIGPVEVFAKLGYYFNDIDIATDLPDDVDADSDGAFSYGGGVGLTILERVALKLEYELIDSETIDDLDAIWFTGAWRF